MRFYNIALLAFIAFLGTASSQKLPVFDATTNVTIIEWIDSYGNIVVEHVLGRIPNHQSRRPSYYDDPSFTDYDNVCIYFDSIASDDNNIRKKRFLDFIRKTVSRAGYNYNPEYNISPYCVTESLRKLINNSRKGDLLVCMLNDSLLKLVDFSHFMISGGPSLGTVIHVSRWGSDNEGKGKVVEQTPGQVSGFDATRCKNWGQGPYGRGAYCRANENLFKEVRVDSDQKKCNCQSYVLNWYHDRNSPMCDDVEVKNNESYSECIYDEA